MQWTAKIEGRNAFFQQEQAMVATLAFAHHINAQGFEAAVLNSFVDLSVSVKKPPECEFIRFMFTRFPADHLVSNLLVDLRVLYASMTESETQEERMKLPPIFWCEFYKRQKNLEGKIELNACDYHVHHTELDRHLCALDEASIQLT
ncbi:hypothetical protein GQ44DRAFT_723772 [Phaeosphaeriaceae sp. PMI808]|nr:hypothetical protein GQ44DRAFT_723772 [Phaeosphaeriaceae sp. PMI808]